MSVAPSLFLFILLDFYTVILCSEGFIYCYFFLFFPLSTWRRHWVLVNHARQLVWLPVKPFAPTSAGGERTSRPIYSLASQLQGSICILFLVVRMKRVCWVNNRSLTAMQCPSTYRISERDGHQHRSRWSFIFSANKLKKQNKLKQTNKKSPTNKNPNPTRNKKTPNHQYFSTSKQSS